MSTHCLIGIQHEHGRVEVITCLQDGMPSVAGRMLAEHYSDASKLTQLISLGTITRLGEEIGEAHPWDYSWTAHSEESPEFPFKDVWLVGSGGQVEYRYYRYSPQDRRRWDKQVTALHRDRGDSWEYVAPDSFKNLDVFEGAYGRTWFDGEYAYIYAPVPAGEGADGNEKNEEKGGGPTQRQWRVAALPFDEDEGWLSLEEATREEDLRRARLEEEAHVIRLERDERDERARAARAASTV